MFSRHRRVWLRRATHQTTDLFRGRCNQAHRRHASALPRASLLLTFAAAAGVALMFRPYESSRATPVWTWAPLPATAFDAIGPVSSGLGVDRDRPSALPSVWNKMPPDERSVSAIGTDRATSPAIGTDRATSPAIGTDRATSPAPISSRAPTGPTHVVARGDTLWTIAGRHSAELASIRRWNAEIDPQRLVVGQEILVPGGSKMKPLPVPAPAIARSGSGLPTQVKMPPATLAQAGDHIWPLPVRGILTRPFSSAHPGIDISAPKGTLVRAIASGRVVWAGWKNNGGGYVVVIEHPDGMRSTYNHSSKVTVVKGEEVAQGATIALVGSTGWSTGPHLDLRIEMGGWFIDPLGVY